MEGQGLSVLWEKDNKIEKETEQEGEKERSEEVENLNVGEQTNQKDSESYWLCPGRVTDLVLVMIAQPTIFCQRDNRSTLRGLFQKVRAET